MGNDKNLKIKRLTLGTFCRTSNGDEANASGGSALVQDVMELKLLRKKQLVVEWARVLDPSTMMTQRTKLEWELEDVVSADLHGLVLTVQLKGGPTVQNGLQPWDTEKMQRGRCRWLGEQSGPSNILKSSLNSRKMTLELGNTEAKIRKTISMLLGDEHTSARNDSHDAEPRGHSDRLSKRYKQTSSEDRKKRVQTCTSCSSVISFRPRISTNPFTFVPICSACTTVCNSCRPLECTFPTCPTRGCSSCVVTLDCGHGPFCKGCLREVCKTCDYCGHTQCRKCATAGEKGCDCHTAWEGVQSYSEDVMEGHENFWETDKPAMPLEDDHYDMEMEKHTEAVNGRFELEIEGSKHAKLHEAVNV